MLDVVAARLRARGERMTRPRRAVVAALAAQTGHLTAEEVVDAVAAVDPRVHRASVYRSLEALRTLGLVQHIHVGHGPTVYHLVGAVGAHPHAQCSSCGALVDLPAGLLDDVARHMLAEAGFVLDGAHVALSGQCSRCAGSA